MAVHQIVLDKIEALPQIQKHLLTWHFRGHSDASWPISSTFERACSQRELDAKQLTELEARILRKFRRRAHHYLDRLPSPSDWIGWQALIRHYGGPTRVVDFTKSLSVALFFAVEAADRDAAVWAINARHLYKEPTSPSTDAPYDADEDPVTASFSRIVTNGQPLNPGITKLEPFELNERISIQQGTFLAPNVLGVPFVTQLEVALKEPLTSMISTELESVLSIPEEYDDLDSVARLVKIIIPANKLRLCRNYLRLNNLDASTLFPGLDGFARSFYADLR